LEEQIKHMDPVELDELLRQDLDDEKPGDL
jgi:hypothetical protein